MAAGDVYEVVVKGRCLEQETNMVFHYLQPLEIINLATATVAEALAKAANVALVDELIAILPASVSYQQVKVRNLFNSADAFDLDISRVGTFAPSADQVVNSFTAISFVLQGDNQAVRAGAKRMAGVTEALVEEGVITEANGISILGDIADAMEADINLLAGDGTGDFRPCVVKRIREEVNGKPRYRLPDNIGELIVSFIAQVTFKLITTSQISRKIGIGV